MTFDGHISFDIIAFFRFFPFFSVEIPNSNGVASAEGGLNFVRIATIGPKENHPIEDGLDIHHFGRPRLRKHSQQSASFLCVKVFLFLC